MNAIDLALETSFVETKFKIDNHRLSKYSQVSDATENEWTIYKGFVAQHKERQLKLVGHRWMEKRFSNFNTIEDIVKPSSYLKEFKNIMSIKSYNMYGKTEDLKALERFLEEEIIDFYYKKSLDIVNPDDFELRYNKN